MSVIHDEDLLPVVLGAVVASPDDGEEVLTGTCPGCDFCDNTRDWAKKCPEERA